MGRFKDGNDPGNGKGKQGKGNFQTTEFGDHILGTQDHDTGAGAPYSITVDGIGGERR